MSNTWKYIKGSEADFINSGAGIIAIRKRRDNGLTFGVDAENINHHSHLSTIIAQRERVPAPQWRYIKGSEADFQGAPDWADRVIMLRGMPKRFANDNKYANDGGEHKYIMRDGWLLVAKRERVVDHLDLIARAEAALSPDTTQSLIAERGARYGKFADNAAIMRQLKNVMHNTPGWSRLSDSQKEALDMITHKIGRMLNGDPDYDDNWKDIAGYATLVADELNGVKR